MLNDYYISIVEKSNGVKPNSNDFKEAQNKEELLLSSLRNFKIIPVLSK